MFHASILQIQEELHYHQQQQEKLEQELYTLKSYEEFAGEAFDNVRDTIEQIEDPKCLELFKESLLSLFPATYASQEVEAEEPIYLEEEPDLDEIEYMDDSHPDYKSIEQLQQEDPDNIAVFHSEEEIIQDEDFTLEQEAELDWQEQLVRCAPDIFYDPSSSKCFIGFSNKNRADGYGSYLTRILDIAEKYTVSAKPVITTNTKYELVLEEIELESAQHLSKFNLKKEYDDSKNKDARELWRTTRKRVHPPACRPSDKLVPLEEVKLGDIVYLNSIDNQYKVLAHKELDGVPHIEVLCVFNSERPSLVSAISYLKECYLVPGDSIQIDPQFQEEKQEEVLTEDVQIYVPKPRTKQKNKPVEVSVFKLGAGDVVHRGIGDSQYEVIGTARKDADLYAECRLISSSTRSASIGNTYYFKDGLYLVAGAELCAV